MLNKKILTLLVLLSCLLLSSCGVINSLANKPTTIEEINELELSEECNENTVVKINRFLPGFFHEDNWYVPTSMRIIMLEDIDYKEDVILRQAVRSDWVEGLKGCMIEGDVLEGSYYNTPYNARVIIDQEDNYYLCDQYHWCSEMSIYDGVDRMPQQESITEIYKNLEKAVFPDGTVITSFKEMKEDVYLPGLSYVFSNVAFYTKDDPKFFYPFNYLYIKGSGFITITDTILNKSYMLYLNDEDLEALDITQKMIEEYEAAYNQEIEDAMSGVIEDNEDHTDHDHD